MAAAADRPPTSQPSGSSDSTLVFIVDDDLSFRDALSSLLRSVGHRVEVFSSASDLLQSKLPDLVSCIVLDVRLPGLSGLDLQTGLADAGIRIPVIFMTGYGDIPMSVRAMKAGAIDFLTKPFRDQEILDAVAVALDRDRKRRNEEKAVADLKAMFDSLTRRERQVMASDYRWAHEQAGCRQNRNQRDHGQDPPWQPHEKDAREVVGRAGANGGGAGCARRGFAVELRLMYDVRWRPKYYILCNTLDLTAPTHRLLARGRVMENVG